LHQPIHSLLPALVDNMPTPSDNPEELEKEIKPLDDEDIELLKTYGVGPYSSRIRNLEEEIKKHVKKVDELKGIKDSDTGLSNPGQWDLDGDAQLRSQHPLQVARCTKIIQPNPNVKNDKTKYVINIRSYAKFVVALHDDVASTDVEKACVSELIASRTKSCCPFPPRLTPLSP